MKISLVTVAGKTHINREYVAKCVATWRRIHGIDSPFHLISDGLRPEDIQTAEELGFKVLDRHPGLVVDAVKNRPALAKIRDALPTWRHVIDSVVVFRESEYVLLIDTDVFVVQPVQFAEQGLDFVYNCDDVPGFRGKWYLPFCEPMVPAINPGFMLLRPSAIDLDFLESLVAKYFIDSKKYWWTRQAALSVIVGRSSRRGIFDGKDVRVVSGNYKRTPAQIANNDWKLFGSNRAVTDVELMRRHFDGAAVLHCAGAGKEWLRLAENGPSGKRVLSALPVNNATPYEKCLVAARMLYNSW